MQTLSGMRTESDDLAISDWDRDLVKLRGPSGRATPRAETSHGPLSGRLVLEQRAGRVGELAERLFALHRLEDLVEVPVAFRLGGRLHLNDVHVVLEQAVGADYAVGDENVVDLRLVHLVHDLVGIGRTNRLDRVEIGERRGIKG